jgi:hypothetical protein
MRARDKAFVQSLLVVTIATPLAVRAASDIARGNVPAVHASVDVSIVVPAVMQLRQLAHPAMLDISADDVARGKVMVTGTQLDLLVNDPVGYVIRARVVNAMVSAVSIVGLPGPLIATPISATLRMASMVGRPRPAPLPVQYELQLSPDAVPGRYAWPVALTLEKP